MASAIRPLHSSAAYEEDDMLRLLTGSALVFLLAACGGETGWVACSSQPSLSISAQWNFNGQAGTDVTGAVNVPLIATPILLGTPASCAGKGVFIQDMPLPAGLQLDPRSGVISGTPTKAITFTANGLVSIRLPGYGDIPVLSKITILP
jgi:hypothetical protein